MQRGEGGYCGEPGLAHSGAGPVSGKRLYQQPEKIFFLSSRPPVLITAASLAAEEQS